MSEEYTGQEQPYGATHWVERLYNLDLLDTAMAEEVSPLGVVLEADATGVDRATIREDALRSDRGIILKNRLLSLMMEGGQDGALHIGDLLALLDRQAEAFDDSDEVRYRQFMGIVDLLNRMAQDEGLMSQLAQIEPNMPKHSNEGSE